MMNFNANDWYWVVNDSSTDVFSSARGMYVPVTDSIYVAWVASGGKAIPCPDEAELYNILVRNGVNPGVLADSTAVNIPIVPIWALRAALATFSGGDKDTVYNSWIVANKATRQNLYYQWNNGNSVEKTANLIQSITNKTGLTAAQMRAVFRDAKKRAKGSGVS